MATSLPRLPAVERLSESVVRILGGNPGKFTLQGTNTYLLGDDPTSLILLDTAQGFSSWRDNLKTHISLFPPSAKITQCILTHWHHDHVLGIPDVLSMYPSTTIHKAHGTHHLDANDLNLSNIKIHPISDGDTFASSSGAFAIQALHTPGHTKDHTAFIITQSPHPHELGSIFTGDNVLGHGTSVFEDLAVYLASLAKMRDRVTADTAAYSDNLENNKIKAYPAHGAVIEDAKAKIEEYIAHRKLREDEAMSVLRYGTVGGGADKQEGDDGAVVEKQQQQQQQRDWTSMEMVKVIYKAVPEHLHEPAERGLKMVLSKLKGEGRVVETAEGKWRISEKATL